MFAGQTLTTGNDNIYIGNYQVSGPEESDTIRIGTVQTTTYVTGISGTPLIGSQVVVAGSNQLGVQPSSSRFKDDVKPMDYASETLLSLKPVTFRYKQQLDPRHTLQFGLVAEDVEKVNPDLVARDDEGKPYTVRYEAVNAMLLNEFLKEHNTVQEQGATIARLEKQVEVLTAGLQKVSAQLATASPSRGGLEASKPAPHVVNNP